MELLPWRSLFSIFVVLLDGRRIEEMGQGKGLRELGCLIDTKGSPRAPRVVEMRNVAVRMVLEILDSFNYHL